MIVSLTPLPDFFPVPRVEVRVESVSEFDGGAPDTEDAPLLDGGSPGSTGGLLDGGSPSTVLVDVPAGTNRVTLWRSSEGRALKVRGGVDRNFLGTLALLDMEAGFDTESMYELECWDGADRVGRVALGSIVLPGPDVRYATVVQQPLDPSLNVVLEETQANARDVTRVGPAALVSVEGASYPTLVSSGPRSGLGEVQLSFAATSRETAASVWATLGSEDRPQLPVWLVRSRHPLLPRVFFCDTRTLREIDVNLHVGGVQSRFELTTTEVKPPAPALVAATLTYADLAAVFPTYTGQAVEFPTYSGMGSAWEYSGAAGG